MIARSPTRLLFALVIALAVLFVVLALLPEGGATRATPHPVFPGMLVGGDGSYGRVVLVLAWLFGALQVLLYSTLVALGAGQRAAGRGFLKPLIRWTIVYLFAWTFMIAAYRGWIAGTSEPSLLGLPLPTVMLLAVMWPLPTFYVVLYVRGFRRWVFDDADAARLRALSPSGSGPEDNRG